MWSHDLLAARLSSGSVGRALTRASHHLLSINTTTTLPPLHLLLLLLLITPLFCTTSLFKSTLPGCLCAELPNYKCVYSVCRFRDMLKICALLLATTLFSGWLKGNKWQLSMNKLVFCCFYLSHFYDQLNCGLKVFLKAFYWELVAMFFVSFNTTACLTFFSICVKPKKLSQILLIGV